MDINEKFSKAILTLRRNSEVKITQSDMANESDLSIRFYQDLESGKKNPSLETVNKIAHAFDMKLSEFCKYMEEID